MTFFVWGWWRGFLTQFWALLLVLGAFEAANALGPVLEPAVAQVAAPSAASLSGAAWACALGLVLVVLHVLLRALGLRQASPAFPRPASRVAGALLAGLRGGLLLILAAYVFLEAVVPSATAQRLGAESHVLAWMPAARRRLTGLLGLPAPVQRQAREIEGWVSGSG